MKRETIENLLKGLGVADDKLKEAVDTIMSENGKDIEQYKAEKTNLSAQLKAANDTLDKFKDVDVDGLKGEVEGWISSIDSYIEGEYFREKPIYVYKNNEKVHSGVSPDKIADNFGLWINFIKRKDINFLIKMCMAHYIFEYIHPFYDGNGRMGRFLMSSYLKRKLDILLHYLYHIQ